MARRVWVDDVAAPGDYQDSAMSTEGVPGLALRVTPSTKTWTFRARVRGGRQIRARLGTFPNVGLDAARLQAQRLRDEARGGVDFQTRIATERAEREAGSMTFGMLRDRFLAHCAERVKSGELRAVTAKGYGWSLTSAYVAPLERRLIGTIKRGELRALFTRIASVGQSTALSVLRSIRAALSYAVEHEYLTINPATKMGLESVQGDAAPFIRVSDDGRTIDYSELVATLDALDRLEAEKPLSPWPWIWRVLCYTGWRPSVAEGLRGEELDLGPSPVLRLPAARSKLREASVIPLSDAVAQMLRSLHPKDSGLLFPGRSGDRPRAKPTIESSLMRSYLAADAKRYGWQPYRGARWRDSFQTWADATGQSSDAVDLLVGHSVRTSTRRRHYSTFTPLAAARDIANGWASTIATERRKTARRKSK